MNKEALKRIFDFLERKAEHNAPFKWKILNNEPIIEEDLNVKGGLDLSRTKIETLPEGLKVGGHLDLSQTQITSLPKGLEVGGYLSLLDLNITSLPKGLKVGGDLTLRGLNITSLPKGLEVGGNLFIVYSPLKKYTDDQLREMIYPGFIKGKIWR